MPARLRQSCASANEDGVYERRHWAGVFHGTLKSVALLDCMTLPVAGEQRHRYGTLVVLLWSYKSNPAGLATGHFEWGLEARPRFQELNDVGLVAILPPRL